MEAHEQQREIEVFVTRISKKVIHNDYDPYFDSFAASTTIEQLKEVLRDYYSHGTLLPISAFSVFYKDIEVQDSEPIHQFEQNGWVQLDLRIKDDSTPRRPPEILPTSSTTCCTRGLEAPERVHQLPESEVTTLTCKIINLEINQMNEEFEHIWKYLDVKDLNNMLQVSTSWRNAALLEKNKRFCIQQLRLPYNFSNLDDLLYVNPYVSLLICDSKLEKSLGLNNIKEKLLEKTLCKLIVLEVKECLSTQDPEFESAEDQGGNELTSNCDLLGLFFQSAPQQGRVYVACTSSIFRGYLNIYKDTDQLAEELGLYDCSEYSNSTLLLFIEADDFNTADIATELVCRARDMNSEEKIWYNGNFIELPEALNCHGENRRRITQEKQKIVAIRITGPSVESWTCNVNLRNSRNVVERMLRGFKERIIIFKRHCIALFSAPHDSPCGNSRNIIRIMKRVFPGITVVGLFHEQRKLSTSSHKHDVSLSLIVITYN